MSEMLTFDDRGSLDEALATQVASWLEQGIAERGSGYLVVSGGSTPKPLFSLLSRKTIDWRRVVIMLADERWVPADHDDRNEQMVRSTLLQGPAAEADFLSLIPTPDDSIANVAGLATLLGSLPTFDVVLLGMGEDAHTASLFPCASEIKEGLSTHEGALMTCPKNAPHKRISLSKHRLQNTRHGVVHIVGEQKKHVYEAACRSGDERLFPVCAFSVLPAFDCWWAA